MLSIINCRLVAFYIFSIFVFGVACGPKEAALGTEANPFIFSFVPSGDASVILASATEITDVLSEKTGLVIRAEVPTSYVGSIEAMCAGEAHAGALNTFSYLVAHERNCAEVELVAVRFGSPTYSGQIVASANGGIGNISDLRGKTFCRPDAFSTSGWIIPSITMRAEGIEPEVDLAEILDTGGHSGVIRSVYEGDCDAGATFVDARTDVAEEIPDIQEQVIVIVQSPPIPNDNISFSPSVPTEVRDSIVTALVEMTESEEELNVLESLYSWEDLEPVEDTFYDPFRQVLEASGVDLTEFLNE